MADLVVMLVLNRGLLDEKYASYTVSIGWPVGADVACSIWEIQCLCTFYFIIAESCDY
jgi:hypothetical protein